MTEEDQGGGRKGMLCSDQKKRLQKKGIMPEIVDHSRSMV